MEITINFIGDEYPSMTYMFSYYVKIIVCICKLFCNKYLWVKR